MPKHKIFSIILPSIFILLTVGNFLYHAMSYRNDIFAKFDYTYWQHRYERSQWTSVVTCVVTDPHINPHTCIWDDNWYQAHPKIIQQDNSIGDDGLYAYVGYAYIQGKDPSLLNAELPPFGKYLVGLFELTTQRMGIFSLFFTGLSLLLFFLFTKSIFKSPLIASLTTLLFSLDPILIEQMRAPYLDTLYLCLFILTAWSFLKEKYLLSGITLGLFMSVKPPFFALVILLVYGVSLVLQRKSVLRPLLWIVLSAGAAYIATYIRMFMLGGNFIHFLQVQKYIFHFYSTGAKAVIGAAIPMLVNGTWVTWFGAPVKVTEWTVLWPLSIVGSLVACAALLKDKGRSSGVVFHALWVIGYLAFLIVTPLFPRYLLLLLPFMYNLSIWALLKGIGMKYSWVVLCS